MPILDGAFGLNAFGRKACLVSRDAERSACSARYCRAPLRVAANQGSFLPSALTVHLASGRRAGQERRLSGASAFSRGPCPPDRRRTAAACCPSEKRSSAGVDRAPRL